MSEEEEICEILSTIQKIKDSKQPVITDIKEISVPFSRIQYYDYCNIDTSEYNSTTGYTEN